MIIDFSIKNFRSIKDKITLSFEADKSEELSNYYILEPIPKIRLLKLGIIYGANASGKTNVLKAIDFVKHLVLKPVLDKNESLNFDPFKFDNHSKNENTEIEINFISNGLKYQYELELNQEFISYEKLTYFSPNKSIVYKRNTDTKKKLTSISFGRKLKIAAKNKNALEANTLWNNTVLSGYLKTNFESKELEDVTNWFDNVLKGLVKPKTDLFSYVSSKFEKEEIEKDNLIEFLKKADFRISDVIIEKDEKEVDDDLIAFIAENEMMPKKQIKKIRKTKKLQTRDILFEHELKTSESIEKYNLNYRQESQGTQRYYQFSGLLDLMLRNETIFPIDELESSLHPDLIRHFILSFIVNTSKSQLITTSHFREFLLEKDIYRSDAIWFTEKKECGSTEIFSLSDFPSDTIRNTSSVFNAYKTGKLGATPKLQDYHIDFDYEEA